MRACPACGASNGETDDFCGNCGNYLGWSDEVVAGRATDHPPTPEPELAPESTPEPDREFAPEPQSDPAPPAATAPADSGPPPSAEPAAGAAGRDHGSGLGATAPGTDTPGAPHSTAPTGTVPPTRTEPGRVPAAPTPMPPRAVAPQPVKPAKAVAPRPVVRAAPGDDDVVGAPCPACGTPNPPGRRFCRRCANPLTPIAAAAPLPWWRTVWPFRRRARSGSGRMLRLFVVLAVVLALCAGGFLLLPAGRHLIEDTRDKLGTAVAVTPSGVAASGQLPGHPADDSVDGLNNRYWGAPGPGASVTYRFGTPIRLVDLIITNGASKSAEQYARQARALEIDAQFREADGTAHLKRLTLSDKAGSQTFQVGVSDVTSVRLVLRAPAGLTGGRHVALAEVEFFRRG